MWKYFVLGVALGGLGASYLISRPDQEISAANRHFKTLRVSILTERLVDTCFFDDINPTELEKQLRPLGYHMLGGSDKRSASFGGGLGGRVTYANTKGRSICSATLDDASEPDFADLCQTAMLFHRRLRVYLRQAELADASNAFDLQNVQGLRSVESHNEKCARAGNAATQFSWQLQRRGELYEIYLSAVSGINSSNLSYGGYSQAPGSEFVIQRAPIN